MKPIARRFASGLLLSGLTVGTFVWGAHLGASRAAGHDLLHGTRTASRPASALTYASLSSSRTRAPETSPDGAAEPEASDAPASVFEDVYALLKRNYVDGVPDDSKLAHGAAAAMVASLGDSNSRFLEPVEMTAVNQEMQGVYQGLGAVTSVRKIQHPKSGDVPAYPELRLTLVAVMPGSPAEKAGLRAGDVITHVNGQWIAGYDPALAQYGKLKALTGDPVSFNKLADAIEKQEKTAISVTLAQTKLRDASAKSLTVQVQRWNPAAPPSMLGSAGGALVAKAPGGGQTLTVTVDPRVTTPAAPVTGRLLSGGIGYLKITQFTDATAAQLDSVLDSFGTGPKGIIVDLRSSPGGLLDVAASVAGRLTAQSTLGVIEGKGKKRTPISITPHRAFACPVAVLIDGGTANTSELLAAALKQDGAKLIGAQTFGDAADVKPVALKDGSGFTMTVGQMKTASGASFAGTGVKPDVAVADPFGDDPINRAVETLSGRIARVPSHGG